MLPNPSHRLSNKVITCASNILRAFSGLSRGFRSFICAIKLLPSPQKHRL